MRARAGRLESLPTVSLRTLAAIGLASVGIGAAGMATGHLPDVFSLADQHSSDTAPKNEEPYHPLPLRLDGCSEASQELLINTEHPYEIMLGEAGTLLIRPEPPELAALITQTDISELIILSSQVFHVSLGENLHFNVGADQVEWRIGTETGIFLSQFNSARIADEPGDSPIRLLETKWEGIRFVTASGQEYTLSIDRDRRVIIARITATCPTR